MKRLFVSVAVVALAGIGAAMIDVASAYAGGGNSDNAKACQMDGWQSFVRSDGSTFKNAGDCVSHAARGGVLTTPTGACYDSATEPPDYAVARGDFMLIGPIDTKDNAAAYNSTDGTCEDLAVVGTVVQAADEFEALAKCQEIVAPTSEVVANLRDTIGYEYLNAPSDWYSCSNVA